MQTGKTIFLIIFVFFFTNFIYGQRFKAGIMAGINASQIRGDDSGGYNRLGLRGGLRGVAVLTDNLELSTEIVYAQRGSQTDNLEAIVRRIIHLDYIEVPVLINYLDWLIEGESSNESDFYRIHIHTGFSFSRLLRSWTEQSAYDGVQDRFQENDLSWVAGATVHFSEHFGITARFNTSINFLYNRKKAIEDDPACTNCNVNSLRPFFLSFQGLYMF